MLYTCLIQKSRFFYDLKKLIQKLFMNNGKLNMVAFKLPLQMALQPRQDFGIIKNPNKEPQALYSGFPVPMIGRSVPHMDLS
jgi:hypothetical protein